MIGGTSSDLAAFYTHLATRELQVTFERCIFCFISMPRVNGCRFECLFSPCYATIKYSDLEFIKELGSGTYGTVYYGKWKGSDVAIKKIKSSCFTEDTVRQERLVIVSFPLFGINIM